MVLDAAAHLVSRNLSTSNWLLKLLVPVAAAGVLRTYSAGFVCRDDRNLHDKTYILVVRALAAIVTRLPPQKRTRSACLLTLLLGCRDVSRGPASP